MYEVISIDDLDNFIIENQKYVTLLYFGASFCGPCKTLKEKLGKEDSILRMPNLKIAYIDVEHTDSEEIVKLYKIKILPTQIFVKLYDLKVKIESKIEGYNYTELLLNYDSYPKNI